jgi:hypothetical protein
MADGLITVADLREIFDINTHIGDGRFNRALVAAGRRMRTWVGDEVYEDAKLPVPTDDTRKEALAYAEAHLVMHFAVLGINTALRQTGIVKTENVEGNTVLQYHTPKEIVDLQAQYLAMAEQIAAPYLLSSGTVEAFEVLSISGSQCEGATRSCGCPISRCLC